MYIVIVEIVNPEVEVIWTNRYSMQVFYYGNTGFGTEDLLCMLLKGVCYFYHNPQNGPDWSIYANRGVMLIEGKTPSPHP